MDFYVSYDLVKLFTQKENNNYRYTLANRVYLYLIYAKSGRININQKSDLITFFNTSHSALNKALTYLISSNFISIKKGYITAKSNVNFVQSENDVKFKFNIKDLTSSKIFTNKLFQTMFQYCAMIKGKASVKLSNPQQKVEFIQKQAASYLSKFANRHENTIKKRLTSLKIDNLMKGSSSEMSYQKGGITVLTEQGFLTKEFQKVVHFQDQTIANTTLKSLKVKSSDVFNNCFVHTGQYGYSIVKPIPTTYSYSTEIKFDYNKAIKK